MRARVLVGAVGHESSTFTPLPTRWEDFHITFGSDILEGLRRGSLAGIVARLREQGAELIPTVSAHALPGGVVERRAFEALKGALVEEAAGVDGACIFLHGAMRAEGEDYADSALLAALRAALGPGAPIVAALDLHANVTASMVENADALVAYRTAPHVDTFETGVRAANLLLAALGGTKLTTALARAPILMPGEFAQTSREPMASMVRLLESTDAKAGVLSSSFAKSHPWADVPEQGVAAVVVSEGDPELAQAEASRLASAFWERRAEFAANVETYEVDEAIEAALAAPEPTVFLSDSGDNPGAGGTTDVPFVVERLLAKGARNAAVAAIWDAEAVEACASAGVGQTVSLAIGGKIDRRHGTPLPVSGRVRAVSDGRYYREGRRRPENLVEMGQMAVLSVEGADVVLSRERVSISDPEQMRILGLEPLDYRIVVLKRGYLEPLFQAIAPWSILMLSPGATNCDVRRLEFRRVQRPIYPLDPGMSWAPYRA